MFKLGIPVVKLHRDHVSIPRSGFWVFKRSCTNGARPGTSRFNPSVGILGVQASPSSRAQAQPASFNPSVGILGVQAWAWQAWRTFNSGFNPSVGILGVQASLQPDPCQLRHGFNPSVGILGVQAPTLIRYTVPAVRFQSLGRDSGCSSCPGPGGAQIVGVFQSLGRDSGCSSRRLRRRE